LSDCETPRRVIDCLDAVLKDHGVVYCSIRSGPASFQPGQVETTMPLSWRSYYTDQRYAEIDPGPAEAMRAVAPLKMCFSDRHPTFVWTGRLRGMSRELGEIGVKGVFAVPLVPLSGDAYFLVTFFASEGPCSFDAWVAKERDHLEAAAAMAHYRLRQLRGVAAEAAAPDLPSLSKRETEVVKWLATGDRVDRIAGRLGLSARTVEFHAINARHKLGARTREQTVALAVHHGLIHL